MKFNVGDKVRFKNGRPFSSGLSVEVVREWDFTKPDTGQVKVTDWSSAYVDDLELVESET